MSRIIKGDKKKGTPTPRSEQSAFRLLVFLSSVATRADEEKKRKEKREEERKRERKIYIYKVSRQSLFFSLSLLSNFFCATNGKGGLFVRLCVCVVVGRLVLVGVDDDDDDDDCVFPSPLRGTSVS